MKIKKFILPLITVIILVATFIAMQRNYTDRFNEMDERYKDVIAVNLNGEVSEKSLTEILERNGYVDNLTEAQFLSKVLCEKFRGDTLPGAITDLNKRRFHISATRIEAEGTPSIRKKLENSRIQLGQTESIDSLYQTGNLPNVVNVAEGGLGTMKVVVNSNRPEAEISWSDKLLRNTTIPVAGIIVQLEKHVVDSTNTVTSTPIAYAMTDHEGTAMFTDLDGGASYSVLPIKKGYEFGTPKGTTRGSLAEDDNYPSAAYGFTMQPHSVRLFTAQTLQRIKEDGTATVRTPADFKAILQLWFGLFMLAWLFVFIMGNVGKRTLDNSMASLLMLLTGFSLMLMFGINDPLTERMLGAETAQGIVIGIFIDGILQGINIQRFYQDYLALPFDPLIKLFSFTNPQRYAQWKGFGYLLIAIFMTSLLLVIGHAVGGMTVNLNFFGLVFQPSEIAKYLMIVFMAAWFYRNGESITRYSEEGATNEHTGVADILKLFLLKLKKMSWLIVGIVFLLALYAKLGDMGPAMIVILTFIMVYSLVKSRHTIETNTNGFFHCDMAHLIAGIITYLIMLVIGHRYDLMGLLATIWFVAWIFFGMLRKKIHESAILFNLVVSAFVFGPVWLSGTSVGDRLASRNQMCTNTWGDLALEGGIPEPGVNTQVAEGLWGLASGGITGQGIGNGSQDFIPAFHTDFILASIGEQLGFVGLSFLVILLSILLWKALLAGFHSRHYFTLYLCAGIAIVTGIQFIIIALGSTGIIPLTGVTVPFLSFGRVSMILNITAFGVVMSVTSLCRNTEKQSSYMQSYVNPLLLTCLTYSCILIFILGVFFHYQVLHRDSTLLRPVFVYNTEGAATVHYNPRINKLATRMKPGNIYDRNGILIATSFNDSLAAYSDIYQKYGLKTDFRKVQDRYYPFEEHLFFMLGDYNSKLFFSSVEGSSRGYMAEARHLAELRGYDNVLRHPDGSKKQIDLVSQHFKPSKFLPATSEHRQDGYQLRDYSALLPYLKAGYASSRIKRFNERNETILDFGKIEPKDLQLTIDAGLQTTLQQKLANFAPATKAYRHLQRTSVVVIDASSGDLLASANWPLPDYDRLAEEKETYRDKFRRRGEWTAYTDMDLGVTFATPPGSTAKVMSALAGLRKLDETGGDIKDKVYPIYARELIHVGAEPTGYVGLQRAIVESSNLYFINLVNEMDLYEELAHIYESAGVSIGSVPAYRFDYHAYNPESGWKDRVTSVAENATATYRDYISKRKGGNSATHRPMTFCEPWRWAWGQGTIDMTPLSMARIAATVVNKGNMPITRFLLSEDTHQVPVVSEERVEDLKEAMRAEAHKILRDGRSRRFAAYPSLGGKTGTPERVLDWVNKTDRMANPKVRPINPRKANDGWYICFVEDAQITHKDKDGQIVKKKGPLGIAVRVERTVTSGSSYAKNIADKLVMDALSKEGYF